MPTFQTPEPVSVTLELGVGSVRITASDRTDTAVEVRPRNPADTSDVRAAQRVRVECADGVLRVTGPKAGPFDFSRKTRSVEVSIDLPSGSRFAGEVQAGDLHGTGLLGECRFKTGIGSVRVERTGALRVVTSAGQVTAAAVDGDADVRTGTGKVRLGEVEGTVVVRNSNGDTTIVAAAGEVRVRSANGDITVDRAGSGVEAKTSNGSIQLGEVIRGVVELGTAVGDLEIGLAEGTAARLAVTTKFGQVHNLLTTAAQPAPADETVELRAHTSIGGITIRRS
ncbi:DUF4097 family beta strand repeat-containing protein [Crossiella sp. NPDC003009]